MDRWAVRSVFFAAVAAAGFLYGAHVATGTPAAATPASVARPGLEPRFEHDALRGSFWRPAGSLAERPEASAFERSSWRPASSATTELAGRG